MYTFPKIAVFVLVAGFALDSARADDLPPFSSSLAFGQSGKFVQKDGQTLYRAICQGCHMPDARGAKGAGEYPALAANPKLAAATFPAARVLRGWLGMPSFGYSLTDAQIADVVNYVRTHFDNHYSDALTADDVARLRASTPDRGN
jgi:mono/diheme cytochrome c family protein